MDGYWWTNWRWWGKTWNTLVHTVCKDKKQIKANGRITIFLDFIVYCLIIHIFLLVKQCESDFEWFWHQSDQQKEKPVLPHRSRSFLVCFSCVSSVCGTKRKSHLIIFPFSHNNIIRRPGISISVSFRACHVMLSESATLRASSNPGIQKMSNSCYGLCISGWLSKVVTLPGMCPSRINPAEIQFIEADHWTHK